MESGFRLGKIWGIPVRIHLSWILIVFLMTWSLAVGYFPEAYSTLSVVTCWILGAITSILFAASVLLHELAHAFIAIHHQVPVKKITLFIFGGVAELGQEPDKPTTEFKVAIAGPTMSLLLAAIFGGLWLLDKGFPLLAAPSEWLGRINLTLAVFNMIPGFPLDGGRVLRSLIWTTTGDLKRSTRISAITGQVIAFGFIGFGVFMVLQGQFFNGLWMAFIGWFLQNAATATYAQVSLQQTLKNAAVWQVMSRDYPFIPSDMTLENLVNNLVLTGGKRFFLVSQGDTQELSGIVTIHLINKVSPEDWPHVTAGDIMTPCSEIVSVKPEMTLFAALQIMDDANVAQVPVHGVGDNVVGILTREQILRYVRLRAEMGM